MKTSQFAVLNKLVRCPTCNHKQFHKRSILLNTRGMTFFGLDEFNKTATALLCSNCGRYIWFNKNIGNLIEYQGVVKSRRKTSRKTKRKTQKKQRGGMRGGKRKITCRKIAYKK